MNNSPRFSMIVLLQNDLEAAISFYASLGAEVIFRVEGQWAELNFDGVRIGLAVANEELPERRCGIILEIPDLRAWCEAQESHGVKTVPVIERVHGLMSAVSDTGNNIIEFYQPTPERVKEALGKQNQAA
jgi:catechol 2,3-dioxygenase-like lactoylglutathione lyase family enzyme